MHTISLVEAQWSVLLQFLPPALDASAKAHRAMRRQHGQIKCLRDPVDGFMAEHPETDDDVGRERVQQPIKPLVETVDSSTEKLRLFLHLDIVQIKTTEDFRPPLASEQQTQNWLIAPLQ